MLKLIGSVMVFGSCAALGLSARQICGAEWRRQTPCCLRSVLSAARFPEDGHPCRKLSVC